VVDDALRHRAVRPRAEVGRWLQNLFDEEFTRQTDNFLRDRKIVIDAEFQEPNTMIGRIVDQTRAVPSFGAVDSPLSIAAGTAALPTAPLPLLTTPALEAPPEAISMPAAPTLKQFPRITSASLDAPRQAFRASGWFRFIAALFTMAVVFSCLVGFRLGRDNALDIRRLALAERLGGLQCTIETLRQQGTPVGQDTVGRIAKIRNDVAFGLDVVLTQQSIGVLEHLILDPGRHFPKNRRSDN